MKDTKGTFSKELRFLMEISLMEKVQKLHGKRHPWRMVHSMTFHDVPWIMEVLMGFLDWAGPGNPNMH